MHDERDDDQEPILDISRRQSGALDCLLLGRTRGEEGMDTRARRKLVIASVLCLVFLVGEVVGGVLSNSLAIATDAAHLLTDLAANMISLIAIWLAARPRSQKFSFGLHRAEVLGATLSVVMIWVVTGALVWNAKSRIQTGEYNVEAQTMLITSGLGVGATIIMAIALHQGHGHGHSPDAEAGAAQKKENINVKAAFIHVLGDFFQAIGVFIAALIIYFKPEYAIIDPICTFVFSFIVLLTTIKILKDALEILMEATPSGLRHNMVTDTFLAVDGIRQVHNLRTWSLTTDKTALSAHLVIEHDWAQDHDCIFAQEILMEATRQIRDKYNVHELTLQVEEFQPEMENKCQTPGRQ